MLYLIPLAMSLSPELRMAQWPKTPCLWKTLLAQSGRWVSCAVWPRALACLSVIARWLGSANWQQPIIELPATTVRLFGPYLAGWVTLSSGVKYGRPKSSARTAVCVCTLALNLLSNSSPAEGLQYRQAQISWAVHSECTSYWIACISNASFRGQELPTRLCTHNM